MAIITLYYKGEVIDPTSYITIDNTVESNCGTKHTITVDPGSEASVYVEFIPSDSSTVSITPDANADITEATSYNTSISTYQSSVDSGISNTFETTMTINVRDSNGGAILDTFYYTRLSYNGNSCREIIFV